MERKIVKKIADIFLAPLLRIEVLRYPQFPTDGGALLAVNHIHALDPIIISYVVYPRWLHHLAKEEIFRWPMIAPIARALGAIPLNRKRPGADSIRNVFAHLQKKDFVCMFPQGTRCKKEFGSIKKGAARLALSCRVPIFPVAITGLEKVGFLGLFRRPKVKIVFGDPIPVADRGNTKEEVDALTIELQERMLDLYHQLAHTEP